MTPLRTAIIGIGPHGQRIAKAVQAVEQLSLVAVVDQSTDALDNLQLPNNVRRCRTLDDLAKDGWPQVVCIATNGPSHAAIAKAAMECGSDRLLISKPMACSLDECDDIMRLASLKKVRIGVDHVRRYSPGYRWLTEQIGSGCWGALRCLFVQRPGIGLGCLATHSFDAACYFAESLPRRVTAWIDPPLAVNPRGAHFVDPGGTVVCEFNDQFRAVISQIEDGAGPASMEIDLTSARIRVDEKSGTIEIVERDRTVIPGPGRPAAYVHRELPSNIDGKVDMHQGLVQLLDQLAGDGPLDCDATHGRNSIAILAAAHLSARRGNCPVDLQQHDPELQSLWLPVT